MNAFVFYTFSLNVLRKSINITVIKKKMQKLNCNRENEKICAEKFHYLFMVFKWNSSKTILRWNIKQL